MSSLVFRHPLRLNGVLSVFRVVLRQRSPRTLSAQIPTSDRLRRDVGLPPLEHLPVTRTPFGTRI